MTKKFHIECTHGTSESPVPDFHPLNRDEVVELLDQAIKILQQNDANRARELSSIQIRLGQGIPSLECPYQIDGPVAQRHNMIDEAYVKWMETYPVLVDDNIVDLIMSQYE